MSLFEHQPEVPDTGKQSSRAGRFLLIGLLAAAGGVAVYLSLPPTDEPSTSAAAADPPPRAAAPTPEAAPEPAAATPAPEPAPEPEPAPVGPAEPSVPESRLDPLLRVVSDVPGASVFLDRRFLGTTPFETFDVAPGAHRLNVSAEGYDGFASTVDIGDELVSIEVRFLDVRLDTSISVVHKHRFGSCEGVLRATVDGIHYDTSDDDAFFIPLAEIERHEIDYLEHTLTLKRRDGRTYNFTDGQETADSLFAFHRDVERARERLAEE